jgi:exopolysaccharide biosynthesis polyprenyl glycosylphosphotransferase
LFNVLQGNGIIPIDAVEKTLDSETSTVCPAVPSTSQSMSDLAPAGAANVADAQRRIHNRRSATYRDFPRVRQRWAVVMTGDAAAGGAGYLFAGIPIGPLYFAAAWIVVLFAVDGYAPQVPSNRLFSVVVALKAAPYVALFGLALFFLKPYWVTRPEIILSVISGLGLIIATRLILGTLMLRQPIAVRLIFLGGKDMGQQISQGLTAAGFACEIVDWMPAVAKDAPTADRLAVDLRSLLVSIRTDLVVAAIGELNQISGLIEACANQGVTVVSAGSVIERFEARVPISEIDSHWFLQLPTNGLWNLPYLVFWRAAEIAISVVIGLILFPLMVVLAALIKLESPGPGLLRQRRVGLLGREFEMLKLRSMRADAEAEGPSWAKPYDSRVTRVGRFLRSTHLDEVPQLVNVIRGEMSLIGPRPERPEFVQMIEQSLPHFRGRLLVKPGLTGWAQLKSGYAASISEATRKLEYDLYYVKNRSLRLDLQIALLTAFKVVGGRGY